MEKMEKLGLVACLLSVVACIAIFAMAGNGDHTSLWFSRAELASGLGVLISVLGTLYFVARMLNSEQRQPPPPYYFPAGSNPFDPHTPRRSVRAGLQQKKA